MGVIEALRVLVLGIVTLVFLVPIMLNTLIPNLSVTVSGQPWGNVILLVFISLGFFIALAILVKLSKVIYNPSNPEIDMGSQPVTLFRRP